jgi:prephenate dehydrogenase
MAELAVGIIGLGRVGVSVGLALREANATPAASNHFQIIGMDSLASNESVARRLNALDKTTNDVAEAVRDKDLVVVAVPYAQAREVYRTIAHHLRAGAVIFDLGALKQPPIQWAKEFFPPEVHLIGGTAVLNPALLWDGLDDSEHARADLFEDGTMFLAPAPSASKEAVALVTRFSEILGASVHYVDPAEHDGIHAATEGLPALVALAYFRALATRSSWGDVQRLTNPSFGRATHHLLDTHPDDLHDMLIQNRESLLPQLDQLLTALHGLREVLAQNDRDALEVATTDAEARYSHWLKQRSQGKWDNMLDDTPEVSMTGSFLSGMLGGFLAERIQGKGKNGKRR